VTTVVVLIAVVGVVSLASGPKTAASKGSTTATGSSSSGFETVSTASTTSSVLSSTTSCPPITWANVTGAASISYEPVVQRIVQDPSFTALTQGLCYSFALNYYGYSQGESLTTFVFDNYNGTIIYNCGWFPGKVVVSQIQVNTVLNGTTIEKMVSMGLTPGTDLNEFSCPAPPSASIWVKSVVLVPPYTPAGPTIEVTLIDASAPIVNLTAVLSLPGKNQTFEFSGVNAASPLLAGRSSSQSETIVGPVSVNTTSTYPMTIAGAFQNGTKFSYSVWDGYPLRVEVQSGVPVESTPLELRVNLNATVIKSGDAITATISIFNPLGVNVSVSPDYQSSFPIFSWNAHDFLCGGLAAANPTWSLAGYALFQGHYTAANLSSAGSPLNLNPPLVIECPGEVNPGTVTFLPNSSTAVAYFPPNPNVIGYPPIVIQQAVMNASTETYVYKSGYYGGGPDSLFGYWVGPPGGVFGGGQNATVSSPYFHYFPPGQYTLVVEDMWGQVSYCYFQVTSS